MENIQNKLSGCHLRILRGEVFKKDEQIAKNLSTLFNASYLNNSFMKDISNKLNTRFNSELGNVVNITPNLAIATESTLVDKLNGVKTTIDTKTNEVKLYYGTALEKFNQNNGVTAEEGQNIWNQWQGVLNGYRGQIGEIFVQAILDEAKQTGNILVSKNLKEINNYVNSFLKNSKSQVLNNISSLKTSGSDTREIKVMGSEKELTVSSSQKADVKIPLFDPKNPIGFSVKNYSTIRAVHLLSGAQAYIYGLAGINFTSKKQKIGFAYYLNENSVPENLHDDLLAMYGGQGLIGVKQSGEILGRFLIYINRKSEEKGVIVIPTFSLLKESFGNTSQIREYFNFKFSKNEIKNYSNISELENSVKMSIELRQKQLSRFLF